MDFKLLSLALLISNAAASRVSSTAGRDFSSFRSSVIKRMSQECDCSFGGTCSCDAATEFMQCIASACESGACDCEQANGDHFDSACDVMGAACPSIGLQCKDGHSTCGAAAIKSDSNATAVPVVPVKHHHAVVKEKVHHGHHLFAVLFLFLFLTLLIFFIFTSSGNKVLESVTWEVIDAICVVTSAISLFYVFNTAFTDFADGHKAWHVSLHVGYALVVFFAALFGAWAVRHNANGLLAFNAIFYWVILLAKYGAVTETQGMLSDNLIHVTIITLLSMVFFVVLMLITHRIKPEAGWYDAVETSLMAGAVSSGVCMLSQLVINGMDHEVGAHKMSDFQAHATLGFAALTCAFAVVLCPPMTRIISANPKERYWYGRFLTFVNSFFGLMPYFTVTIGMGSVVCNKFGIDDPTSLMAKLVHSIVNVFAGMCLVVITAFTPYFNSKEEGVVAVAGLIKGLGGYIAGYALATLGTGTIDEFLGGRTFTAPLTEIMVKFLLVIGINAILIPMYVLFLKPLVIKKTA